MRLLERSDILATFLNILNGILKMELIINEFLELPQKMWLKFWDWFMMTVDFKYVF